MNDNCCRLLRFYFVQDIKLGIMHTISFYIYYILWCKSILILLEENWDLESQVTAQSHVSAPVIFKTKDV
jgi:hypothetical protein